ncbi:hypothetical protein DRQ33_07580 [bacterium]|nr:MAG: hypothetical protein DRQ33_07580 [bacterium]
MKLPSGGIGPASEWADVFDVAAGWPTGEAIGLEYSNGYVIASNQSHGIVSIDVGTPTDMTFGDEITDYSGSALTPALGMDIDGTDLYLCCAGRASENFFQVDISNPTSMSVSNAWNVPYQTYNVDVSGGYAYIGHSDGVYKYQISPWTLSDSLIDGEESYSIIVDGSYVYVAHWNLGLYVLDVTDLDPPVATIGLAGKANDIAKNGDYIYVAAGSGGLYKIDVSDPGTGIDSVWHQDTINGYPNSVSMYGDYVVVGLLESPSGQDLRIYSEAGNLVHVCPSSPPPTHIGQETVVAGNYVFMSDYFEGVKAWHVGDFNMDSLNQTTILHSNKINEIEDFQYVHWESYGEVADSTTVLDTAYFYIVYGNSVDNLDTFRIMHNPLDPPDNIDGSPGYHNLLNQYDYLYWFGEISSHIDVAFPHWHDSTDTAWSIDSIKILYSGSPAALLRTAGSVEIEVGELIAELSVIFDEGAEIGTDSLDVPSLPDDPARWLLDGNEYRTISLPYNEPAFGLQLVIDDTARVTSMSLNGATVYIDGRAVYDEMSISAGTHPTYAGPPWVYRYPMPLKIGWNMISLPGTVPANAELFPTDQIFSYNPVVGSYVIAEDLMPGRGYFCFANENYAFYDGVSIERMNLVLEEGWNLVGGISETVSLDALSTSPADAILPYCIFSLVPGSYAYYPVDVLEPRLGYWIFALTPCTLSINDGYGGLKKTKRQKAQTKMPLELWSGTVRQTLALGIAEKSTADFDIGLDEPMPPVLPLQPILGYFSFDGPGGKLMTDVRPEGDQWHLVILEPTNLMLKSDYRLGGICIMGDNTSVSIFGMQSTELQPGKYRLLWQESQFTAIPTRTVLKNAFPNPFNATLEVDVELAEDNGELEILDILGRSVCMFELSGKGVHHIKWNAQTSSGKEMPSGVYFVSLRTDETTAKRRVLLVK